MKYFMIFLILVGLFTSSAFAFEPAYTNYFSNPEFQTYSIVEKNYKYDIPFHLSTGVLESMTMDCESTLLLLEIKTDNAGYITIHLPRVLIDSKINDIDDDFFVLLDDEETTFEETSDSVSRTLTIPFESDVTHVEIIGVNYPEHTGINACNEDHNPPYSYWFPPLKQSNSGIPFNEIQCNQNLVLLQKYDGSPACVTESTKTKLVERGWTTKNETKSKYTEISDVEKLLIENKINYNSDKLVVTSGVTIRGDPGCGAVVDVNSKIHWFGIDSISNPREMTLYDENPNQCVVNTSSCFCNVQIELSALTLDELDYFTPQEQEKYADILIDYLYEENINRTPKFMIGKHNVNYTDPTAVGYCGKIWGTATRDYFSGAIVDGTVKDYGIDKELPLLCAITDDAQYFGKAYGEE